ncbi:MAG: ABC transporter ATP-binding protein [Anaerolineales bacterium]|nr:ABC transporter ATP-binding protein [Anaerolineales bacterium]MBX3005310.1 ABC transporter ATP-binding protein [Anaerolineales bacterium]
MLELRKITKSYAGRTILNQIDLQVATGEVLALLGPSGSGKSTLLSIVAGLEAPDGGQVLWDGAELTHTPAHLRNFGLMFQDFALFPHRNVFGNVAFGLQMARQPDAQMAARVSQVLQSLGLAGFEPREVASLSGGEQQRVALARALAPRPRLLMLDEPLGSLDRALRTQLLTELTAVLRQHGQTSLYVTHDQEEAYAIADRIAILNAGRLVQVGPPQELYRQPASAFVARFLGMHNVFHAEIANQQAHTPLGLLPVAAPDGPATLLLRPDRLSLGSGGPASLAGHMAYKQFRGSQWLARVDVRGVPIELELSSAMALPPLGAPVTIHFEPAEAVQILADD